MATTTTEKVIALSDTNGNMVYFSEGDLMAQIVSAGIATGGEAAKAAARHFADKVKRMRRAQAQRSDSVNVLQRQAEEEAQGLEKEVDRLTQLFSQTIAKL